jgi:hypothetical protein
MRSEEVDAEEVVDSVDRVCRKGNDDEKPPCCRRCWNSWFTKAELGHNMDAGIGVELNVLYERV